MYNRYIPQPDGSYRRNRMQDMKEISNKPDTIQHTPSDNAPGHLPAKIKHNNINGFIRQLLPKEFDTGDLIIVLLLLLMAGDKSEEKTNALLTLALYFIM